MKIKQFKFPKSEDVNFLTRKINESSPELDDAYPFGIFAYDDDDLIIAGASGSVVFLSIYTDQLWIDPKHRMQGLGRQLMEDVHAYGKMNNCSMATVQTMTFQGVQNFYKKLGYVLDLEQTGYVNGSSCLFFKKSL